MKILNCVDMAKYLRKLGPRPGRLLGLDPGSMFVGSAISDISLEVAEPLRVFYRSRPLELKKAIHNYNVSGVIIGLPTYQLRKSDSTGTVERYVDSLIQTGYFPDLKVCYWDECCTSKNARLMVDQVKGLTPNQRRDLIDKFAAVGVLQGFLDYYNDPDAKPWKGIL